MRFGQTLFGGAVTGLVIASGIAVCAAVASAQCEVIRQGAGSANAIAQSSGYGLRRASAEGTLAQCSASASGAAAVYFNPLPSTAACIAEATGHPQATFSGYGFANGYSLADGRGVRTSKLFPLQARAYAHAEGDGHTWQIGYALPAHATAWALGTTYYVGRGTSQATASATATPAMQIGGTGHATAISHAQGTCVYTAGMAGVANCAASAIGDAAVTSVGVRYFEGRGLARATATAVVTTVAITQGQTARGFATAVGYPKLQIGGKGRALAIATGYADPLVLSTAATAEKAHSSAVATAKASVQYSALPLPAQATASASGNGKIIQTRAEANPARATAALSGTPLRTILAYGRAECAAVAEADSTKTQYVTAQAIATAQAQVTHSEVRARGAPARAEAFGEGQARRTVIGHAAPAEASASATGSNQVNDLSRAPLSRTLMVESEDRLTRIPSQPRMITV